MKRIDHHKRIYFVVILIVFLIQKNVGQDLGKNILNENSPTSNDTLVLTIEEADIILSKYNLLLFAQQMNIKESFAQVVQARLWDNPTLYLETNPRNQISNQYFNYRGEHTNSNGVFIGNDIVTTLDQIIKTAGKRKNLVKLNKIGADISEDQFYDLMRALKYAMRSDYYLLLQYQQGIELLEAELKSLNYLIDKINTQVNEGNMPLKDLLRLQALAFDIENNIRGFITEKSIAESNLKTILRLPVKVNIIAVKDTNKLKKVSLPSVDSLSSLAYENRFDLKAGLKQLEAAERNYKLQKSLAYPDLDVGITYVRYSNYIPNYKGVFLRTNIPVLNRNQGNIKTAEFTIQEQRSLYENQLREAFNDLSASYVQFLKYQNVYFGFKTSFENRYDIFIQGLTINYEQHLIGLIEFVDFFESYRNTKIAAFNLEQDFLEGKEQLNYQVGKDIFK